MAIFWWLERTEKASSAKNLVGWLASLSGLAAIFAMAQLYMKTIISAWQSANTLIDFYATAIALGAIVIYVTAGQKGREKLPSLNLIVLGVVFLPIAFLPNYLASLGAISGAGQESVALLSSAFGVAVVLRWLFVLGGVFLLVLSRMGKFAKRPTLLYLAVVVLVIGEVMGLYIRDSHRLGDNIIKL